MTEQRFTYKQHYNAPLAIGEAFDGNKKLTVQEMVELLNEQQATIITLKRRLEKINGGYGHLTHRNELTANEWLIESQERELKKKNEQISDWIERHSKDIATICEQQATINEYKKDNAKWRRKCLDLLVIIRTELLPRISDDEVRRLKEIVDNG